MATSAELIRMLQQAEAERMANLLAAWQAELDAAAEAAEQRKLTAALQDAERANEAAAELRRRMAAQINSDLLEASAAEQRLYGILQQAIAGYDVSVSVPGDVNVASGLIVATADAELSSLFGEIDQAEDDHARAAQKSVAWAMQHGFIPHPSDLGTLASQFEANPTWGAHFESLAGKLDDLVAPSKAPALLQARVGSDRIDVIKQTVAAMDSYSPGRLFLLVGRPQSLAGTSAKNAPTSPGRLNARAVSAVVDSIFA